MANVKTVISNAIRIIVRTLFFGVILFVPAGRPDWREGWYLIATLLIFFIFIVTWGLLKDPALLKERNKAGKNVKSWDKIILKIYTPLIVVMFVLSGLDSGRFHWSSVPFLWFAVGWGGLLFAMILIWRTMVANTYLSSMVRIQDDRGHRVVSTGPYRFVRHPMYVGILITMVSIPLVLKSFWALIPAFLIDSLFILRTVLEDKTLHQELEGYRDYSERVRYKMIPGLW